jgi:ribosomal protein S18
MPTSHLCVVIVGGLHADARQAADARLLADVPDSVALHHDLATAVAGEDTDLLRKFISDRGKIRSRRVTRVTARQQRMLPRAIKDAREMAL